MACYALPCRALRGLGGFITLVPKEGVNTAYSHSFQLILLIFSRLPAYCWIKSVHFGFRMTEVCRVVVQDGKKNHKK